MKLKWLDTAVFYSPVFYTLATSQKMMDQELKRMKMKHDLGVINGKSATTHFLTAEDGRLAAMVCLFDHTHDIRLTYALLVHEAVHIYQEIIKHIGEDEPGPEFEAYLVQKISQELFFEYDRQTRGKRNGKNTR